MIKFRCKQCGQKLGVDDDKAGKQIRCPQCKVVQQVPEAPQPSNQPTQVESPADGDDSQSPFSVLAQVLADDEASRPAMPTPERGQRSQDGLKPLTKLCPYCKGEIPEDAKKCRHCGEWIDGPPQQAASVSVSHASDFTDSRSRGVAIVLALFLGHVGGHRFYLGMYGWGLVSVLICWTFIPAIVALLEAILYIFMTDEKFQKYYLRAKNSPWGALPP